MIKGHVNHTETKVEYGNPQLWRKQGFNEGEYTCCLLVGHIKKLMLQKEELILQAYSLNKAFEWSKTDVRWSLKKTFEEHMTGYKNHNKRYMTYFNNYYLQHAKREG